MASDAPNITKDTAFYKPELKGRHVVVTPEEVRRVGDLIATFTGATPRCKVLFADGWPGQRRDRVVRVARDS